MFGGVIMTVCYFGIYRSHCPRNKIFVNGLKLNGIEVIECQSNIKGLKKYIDLIIKHWKIRKKYDVMLVGFPCQQAVFLAKFISRKPIVINIYMSTYDSMILSRGLARTRGIKAIYYWFLDWASCKLADKIILDTKEYIDYFVKTFKINKKKFARVYIGALDNVFYPIERKEKNQIFTAVFTGMYIPLQGIEYIIEAAKILEGSGVKFLLVGGGQEKENIVKLANDLKVKNVEFIGFSSQEVLRQEIAKADVCLGIFGNVDKTKRVIPNKVYECIAMRKPVITADTKAIRELFTEEDLWLVKISDANAIAEGILKLKNSPELRKKIADNGYNKFIKNVTPKALGQELKNIIQNIKK